MESKQKTIGPSSSLNLEATLLRGLVHRLNRIEGHLRGIKKMLAEGRDCDDILVQIAGVKAAISQVALKMLEGHLECCVAESLRSGDGASPLQRFKKSMNKVIS